ncbi:MAG: WYL domain-containing protein [Bacteroidales bacterium]|nr:WYL domain-containing protein [Bacteroidales bacterium]
MNRAIWLARLLFRHEDGLTKPQILEAWRTEDDKGLPMRSSTFYDNRNYLENRFGLKIVCRNRRYFLEDDNSECNRLLLQLEQGDNLNADAQTRQPGDEWLPLLANAVSHNYRLLMEYAPLDKPAYETRLDAYFLRLIHGRYYVVGRSARHDEVRNFAVDRIATLTQQPGRFRRPAHLVPSRWFGASYGAFAGDDVRSEHLVFVSHTPRLTTYLQQRPIHHSQRLVEHDGRTEFHLDVALTPDLIGVMLTLAAEITILEPVHLRELLASRAQAIMASCHAADSAI